MSTHGRLPLRMTGGMAAIVAGLLPIAARAADLEEIIVTSRKQPELASRVPATLTVLSQTQLVDSNAHDLIQMAERVPGMVFSRAPDDGLALTIRGIGTPARSQAFDQSVALFLDGVFLAKGRLYPEAFFDLERIEVLKGPQSAVLGKNTSVGAITLVSREPGNTLAGEFRAEYEAEKGGYVFNAASDVPLSSSTAVRIAVQRLDTNGWVKNEATGRNVPEDDDLGTRLTLRSTAIAGLTATVRFQHSESERIGTGMQLVAPDGTLPYETVLDDHSRAYTTLGRGGDSLHSVRSSIADASLIWALGRNQLVSQSSYVAYRSHYADDLDFNESDHVNFLRHEDYRQIAQELRFESSPDQPISYRLGASYLASQWNSVENQIWATPGYPPGTLDAGQLFNGPFVNDFRQHTGSEALFGLINWHVADQWRATLGLRETHETKDVLYGRTASAPLTKWNTLFNPPFAVTPLSFGATFMDGNASLQWSATDSTQWYVTVGRGTKLGGFAETNGVPHADPAVDARIETEVTHDYELGVKSALLGRRLRLNAAVFDMEIDNFQDTTFNGIAFVTINLPARSRGAEWEVAWQVNDAWQIGGAATYADASENINGARFPMTQAPKWTAVASAEYARPLGATLKWRARIDGRYRAVMYNQRGGLFPSSSFDTIGVLLALEQQRGRWGVELVGRNLNNRVTADFSGPTPDPTAPMSSAPARLRTVTISGWARF